MGANGFIGSHVCDALLKDSYNVRGTVRNLKNSHWLSEHFEAVYGKGRFELVEVPDLAVEGCFDEAIRSMSPSPTVTFEQILKMHDRLLWFGEHCRRCLFRQRS